MKFCEFCMSEVSDDSVFGTTSESCLFIIPLFNGAIDFNCDITDGKMCLAVETEESSSEPFKEIKIKYCPKCGRDLSKKITREDVGLPPFKY